MLYGQVLAWLSLCPVRCSETTHFSSQKKPSHCQTSFWPLRVQLHKSKRKKKERKEKDVQGGLPAQLLGYHSYMACRSSIQCIHLDSGPQKAKGNALSLSWRPKELETVRQRSIWRLVPYILEVVVSSQTNTEKGNYPSDILRMLTSRLANGNGHAN